jgi:tetrahydromethanopterin S-methyltransferase subunit G
MANPEHQPRNMVQPSAETDFQKRLEEIEKQLELVDENENTIEREAQREELLEQLDLLHDEADNTHKKP